MYIYVTVFINIYYSKLDLNKEYSLVKVKKSNSGQLLITQDMTVWTVAVDSKSLTEALRSSLCFKSNWKRTIITF